MKMRFSIIGAIITTTLVGGGFYWLKQYTDDALAFHCDNINKDFTRPEERKCVTPLAIDNNNFTFKTKNNHVETYGIIALSGSIFRIGDEEEFYYIFLNYQE